MKKIKSHIDWTEEMEGQIEFVDSPILYTYAMNRDLPGEMKEKFSKQFLLRFMETFYNIYCDAFNDFSQSDVLEELRLARVCNHAITSYQKIFIDAYWGNDYYFELFKLSYQMTEYEFNIMSKKYQGSKFFSIFKKLGWERSKQFLNENTKAALKEKWSNYELIRLDIRLEVCVSTLSELKNEFQKFYTEQEIFEKEGTNREILSIFSFSGLTIYLNPKHKNPVFPLVRIYSYENEQFLVVKRLLNIDRKEFITRFVSCRGKYFSFTFLLSYSLYNSIENLEFHGKNAFLYFFPTKAKFQNFFKKW